MRSLLDFRSQSEQFRGEPTGGGTRTRSVPKPKGRAGQMNSTRIEEAVDAALTPVQTAIVTAARTAYRTVATKYHDPNDGCDPQTFGILIYKFFKHQITITAQDPAYGIVI